MELDALDRQLAVANAHHLAVRRAGRDLELVRDLALVLDTPVIAEGRYWTPELVGRAFDLGAYAVVVGTAITDPRAITRRFAAAVPSRVS